MFPDYQDEEDEEEEEEEEDEMFFFSLYMYSLVSKFPLKQTSIHLICEQASHK
jgi:hypothetical protein